MKKAISILLAVLVMLSCFAGFSANAFAGTKPPFTGWYYNEDSEYWSYYEKGSYVSEDWRSIDGKWYYFGEYGNMYFDGIYEIGEDAYYFNKSGAMLTGWIKDTYTYSEGYVSTNWYYAESSGRLAEGWKKISGKWYYFDYEMAQGSYRIDGKLYAFDKNGAWVASGWAQDVWGNWYYVLKDGTCATGWQSVGGTWYYFAPDGGQMYIGAWVIDGKDYFFNGSGAWVKKPANGWNSASTTYYSSTGKAYKYTEWAYYQNGKAVKGWKQIGGKWYYFYDYGNMAADTYIEDGSGKFYFMNADGSLRTTAGWVQETYSDGTKGNWFYTDSKGVCATGWKKISGKWYCFSYDSGFMYANTTIEDGGNYYLVGKDGAMISKTGWASLTETWNGKTYTYWYYVENSSGVLATSWKEINGITYYFDTESGEMYCDGYYDIDGYEYYFNETGECEGRTDEF